jgi:multidrug efflux pump subunit AcrA (membrane-fusion protein)
VIGTLIWIGTEVNSRTRTVQARAEVENPLLRNANEPAERRLLQANAFGTAQIVVATNPTTVVVPSDALHWQWEIERNIVFVSSANGRSFEPRIVRKGLERDNYSQIVDGLAVGEQIVTAGGRILATELAEAMQQRWGDNSEAARAFGITTVVE